MELTDRVLEVLKKSENEPLKAGAIAEKLDVHTEAVSKALVQLKKEGLIYSPKRCFYAAKL